MTISLRFTTPEDLAYVIQAEQAEQKGGTIGLWSNDEHQAAIASEDMAHFIIERDRDRHPIGYLILQDLTNPDGNIQIRRIVVTEKGKGYGRQGLKKTKQLAFETYGAYRLWLDVKPYNSRAKHLYESEGWVEEGTLRDCVQLEADHPFAQDTGKQRVSLTLMSILRSEYEEQMA